jgi:uncharacterized repeat protein (TIGR01451 family)
LVDPPLNGIVTLDPSGTFTYTPDPGYSGPDSFTYDVCVPVPNGGTGGLPTEVCSEALATLGVTPSADLVITKSHNAALVPGGTVTYLIGVTNHGPSDVVDAHVTDQLPAGLSDATWICTSTIGAACSANSGIGSPNLYVDLPVAASATIEVLANVKADATGDIINTATIETPPGVTDPDPSSNSATDPGTIGQASGGALALTGSPSFAWAFWGFVLMAIGAGLVLMTRRARRRTSS